MKSESVSKMYSVHLSFLFFFLQSSSLAPSGLWNVFYIILFKSHNFTAWFHDPSIPFGKGVFLLFPPVRSYSSFYQAIDHMKAV